MGLLEKWRNWRELSARKSEVIDAIQSRNPEAVKTTLSNLQPEEVTSDEKSDYLRRAIDEQNVLSFKEVLRFVDDPNLEIGIDKGGRYVEMHYYSPLAYALGEAHTHDISLMLAGDPRVKVKEEYMETAKNSGMGDVVTVLTKRMADVHRHEADLRLQEAAHLDQEAAKPAPVTQAQDPVAPPPAAANNNNDDIWALIPGNSIAHVVSSPAIGRKLTNIFNFDDRERVIITENLTTGKETVGLAEKFDAISPDAVKRAEDKLKALTAEVPKRTFTL